MAIFECARCKETFCEGGMHVIINEESTARVCPACLAGAHVIQVSFERSSPGKSFNFQHFQVLEPDEYEGNNG